MADDKDAKSSFTKLLHTPDGDLSMEKKDSRSSESERFITQLGTTLESSSDAQFSLFKKNIGNCLSFLDGCPPERYNTLLLELLDSSVFNSALEKLLLCAICPESKKQEYFIYDRKDFEGQSNVTTSVLEFFIKLLSKLKCSGPSSYDLRDCKSGQENCEKEDLIHVIRPKLSFHLPHLLLMVAGNAQRSLWTSEKCIELSQHLIRLVFQLYGCDRLSEVMDILIPKKVDSVSSKSLDRSVISHLLYEFELPLSRERWERNPFLCEAFLWFVMQLTGTQMSFCLSQSMAVALNFLYNFDAKNKLKGLQLLNKIITSVSNEELRWYNRAEVIYDTLKNQLYLKESLVLDVTIGCIFSIVQILEKPQGEMKRHNFILTTLLTNAKSQDLLALRRIYISRLAQFVLCCGIACIGHLGNILRVIESYLEVDDGPEELARLSALDVLENLLKVTWPRIGLHSLKILKFLLKFVVNINSSSFLKSRGESLKIRAEEKVIDCFKLLSQISPNVKTFLKTSLIKSDHHGYLSSFIKALTGKL